MPETFDPNIIVSLLSGKAGDLFTITQLMTRAFFVLVAGLVIWRIAAAYSKPKPIRERRKFMESKYQENWRKHQK
ncbi:hypothetical protein DNU06_10375 [Putridiphycobacter roseus]|uniref:Uncharacterized protein n=1 Tax=Putridiphycobacter roseus TaxID=2219161 RepID=A0A2W1NR31_9FLAO|nr:hypothetical protein [Putridiphycobacter roseus]PZE17138.1 hypothetical protein DNU06_10375 [Putridiphycobacter roseus]